MTTPSDPHSLRVAPLRALERRLLLEHVEQSERMRAVDVERVRYAMALARLDQLRVEGRDVDLFDAVSPFRHWLIEQLELFVDARGRRPIDWGGLANLTPTIVKRADESRRHLLERHVQDFDEERLESEVRHRRLVLVLGGGGGSGYSHLGTFSVLSELGIVPSMIVGSSMGAMLGLFRASMRHFDPLAITVALPRPSEYTKVFSPYRGHSRFGFPGTFELNIQAIARDVFRNMLSREVPLLSELPIPLRPVVTGLRTGVGVALSEVESEIDRARAEITPFAFRRRGLLLLSTVRTMAENPRFLSRIVCGSDPEVRDFDAVDAAGFSCAVPGILHYDVFERDSPSARALKQVMENRQLFRLTDGGIVGNVPSSAAWRCVQAGEITSRNAFILSFDAFAPLVNANAAFIPVQKVIHGQVLEERAYSDYHHTYRTPPPPTRLLLGIDEVERTVARVRRELQPVRAYLAASLRPLPRWAHLREAHLLR
jgi:hypothetical protein